MVRILVAHFFYFFLIASSSMFLISCTISADIKVVPAVTDGVSELHKIYFDSTLLNLSEGAAAIVSVQLTEKISKDLVVSLTLSGDVNAITSCPTEVTIPAGSLSVPVTIQIADDFVYTGQKTVYVKLSTKETNFNAQPDTLTLSIAENDLPIVTFTQTSQTEIEDPTLVTVTAMLNAVSAQTVTVPLTLSGTATQGSDYTISSSTITIPAGQTSGSITIQIIDDTAFEPDETVIVTLGSPINAAPGSNTTFTLTITNDDLGAFAIAGITGASDAVADAFLVGGLTPIVSWSASAGATDYVIKILAADGVTVVCAQQITTLLTYNFSTCNLTMGQTYKALVQSRLGALVSSASNSLYSFYVNSPPIANNDGPVRIMKGSSAVTLNVVSASDSSSRSTVADSDPDAGDTVTITAVSQGTSGGLVTFTASTATYTPSASFTGVETFTYTLTDSHGASAGATVTMNVMDTYTWTGKVSSAWGTSGNWCGTIASNQCQGLTGVPNQIANSNHKATFDGTCTFGTHTCNSDISSAISTYSLNLNLGYTGLVRVLGSGSLTLGQSFSEAAGQFDGTTAAISLPDFTLSGGTFTSTSNTMTVTGNFAISNTPTFNANNGNVYFYKNNSYAPTTLNSGNILFYSLTSNRSYSSQINITGTTKIAGALNCNDSSTGGGFYGGTIELGGDWTLQSGGCQGSTNVKLVGTGTQTITSINSAYLPSVQFASTGTVNLSGTHNWTQAFVYTSGAVNVGTARTVFINTNAYSPTTLVPGNIHFQNVEVNRGYSSGALVTGTLIIDGNLDCNSVGTGGNSFDSGTVLISGNLTLTNYGCSGSALFKLVGVNQTVTANSGTYLGPFEIATSGTTTLAGVITLFSSFKYTSGTVDAGTSLVRSEMTGSYSPTIFNTGSVVFNNFYINRGYSSGLNLVGTLKIAGDLTCNVTGSNGGFSGGAIDLKGNLIATNLGCQTGGAASPLTFSGNGNVTANIAASAYLPLGLVTVAKGSGTLTLNSNFSTSYAGQNLTIQSGTVNLNGFSLFVNNIFTISTGSTLTVSGGSYAPNTGINFINNGTIN